MMLIITAFYWGIAALRQSVQTELGKQLRIETVQNRLFQAFIRILTYDKSKAQNGKFRFTKEDIIDHFIGYYHRGLSPAYGRGPSAVLQKLFGLVGKIDFEVAESLANSILERATSKGVIEKDEIKSLSDAFFIRVEDADFA